MSAGLRAWSSHVARKAWPFAPAVEPGLPMHATACCLLRTGLQTTGTEAQTDTESAIGARSGMYRPIAAAAAAAASLEPL